MSAISGTRRALKELVDGTIRVQIDIDPKFKKQFLELFPTIDMPVAIAPLNPEFEKWDEETRLPARKQPQGPLCQLAAIWCKESYFQQWLSEIHGGQVFNEQASAEWVRKVCRVESRSEIDKYETTEATFKEKVRAPFRAWMEKQING